MSKRLNGHVPFYSRALPAKFSSMETQFFVGGARKFASKFTSKQFKGYSYQLT